MKRASMKHMLMASTVAVVIAAVSACAPPPPAPTPPPARIVIPPRPWPPMGAAPNLNIPQVGPDGIRRTVNTALSTDQTTWNFRSAYNVAALNCLKPEHAGIVEGYRAFLKSNSKVLTKVNANLDKQFKANYGSSYIRQRETYNTQVYNYFALPPTLPAFCDAALSIAQQSTAIASSDLEPFAATSLARIESVFSEFYNSYDQYRADLAAWDARYGAGQAPAVVDTPSTQSMAQ